MRSLLLASLLAAASARAATVAIDIGHFIEEPGATSAHGRPELDFNRDLAVAVDSAVKGRGLKTMLIGYDGFMSQLTRRTAAGAGADFFLSVHHDSVQPYLVETWEYDSVERWFSDLHSGFSLFVSRKNRALKRSLACASAIGAALRAAGFSPSLYHAEAIPGENKPFADKANGVHYYDNLIVLKSARTPAVLLEAGVILNREEDLRMRSEEVQKRIAGAVAQGLARCLAPRS
ncbi:MAG TPA: N-acetylmuramoyl-L-alanine amidase [Burkholderiales bacterium]|nr:N-acetylmuramoyl-L-alanine amidase [Burkholderiales bacterium]